MRPEILYPLFAQVTTLPGVGGRTAAHLARMGIARVVDLLWHLPTGMVDRRHSPRVKDAGDGVIATLTVEVARHHPAPPRGRRPYRVKCFDDSGTIDIVFFHANRDYIQEMLPEGAVRVISGKVEHFHGQVQMSHPDYILRPEDRDRIPALEPVYPLTAGLSGKVLRKAITAALDTAPDLQEWLEPAHQARQGWPDWRRAITAAHAPDHPRHLLPESPARARLAYDELLANQLALALVRERLRKRKGRAFTGDGHLRRRVEDALPFALTGDQRAVLEEIAEDMARPEAMLRLVQGDVGSGKTLVALLAMLIAVEAGAQAALLAPTEILARQHAATLAPLAAAAGVRLALLTGRDKGKSRRAILDDLASGEIDILVGTHALIERDVAFRDLGLAVIDEQHRFGVHQRLKLTSKGRGVDVLVMTATPIPRTLSLTAYGDMDVSRIIEKPPGRKPVETRTIPAARLDDVVAAIGRALKSGARAYWVCPLVEESETSDMAAAEARYKALKAIYGDQVGLVHGKMKAAERDAVMADFAAGRIALLVATTVIEVGVDVPEATIMVIEHAERFGLAQLHQLRGRVGRGGDRSTCLLLYAGPLSETARARLRTMRETDDGFRIAEEDLRLRGPGEVLGTRQSGLPEFRIADLAHHEDLLATARKDAVLALSRDPKLESARGQALRVLLYLFERDAAIRYLQSG
ncbi:MAG: ATP-dependent DNA helicase RecG [Alphaproteobacteria bacterium]|nr:MAG: ATP-dependent DNA helicase RecG [Alphaproteobacteria bacterium]